MALVWLVEGGLAKHQARQKARILTDAGLQAAVVPDGRRFGVESLDAGLRVSLEEFLDCHRLVVEEAARQGIRVEPYKPLDRAEIVAALHTAWEPQIDWPLGGARLWHELVWAQGLPNTNHRSALLFVERCVNRKGEPARFLVSAHLPWAETLLKASKPIILDKEFQPDLAAAKSRHFDLAREAFLNLP